MSNIACDCLSDLHLGDDYSLLNNVRAPDDINAEKLCPALLYLVECLERLVERNATA